MIFLTKITRKINNARGDAYGKGKDYWSTESNQGIFDEQAPGDGACKQ